MEKTYTADDIKILSDFEHVRARTNVYLGNMNPTEFLVPDLSSETFSTLDVTFVPAVYKAVGEIIDNALDEFAQLKQKSKLLTIAAQPEKGQYSISDNGRGVPIEKHASGKFTPQVVFGTLRSGRNFTDDKNVGVIGANGVGSSCVNACSVEFGVTIHRDGKKYQQKFSDGAAKVSVPKVTDSSLAKTGTEISFNLDPDVFKDIALPSQLMRNRAIEIAMINPDITVDYNGERFKFKRGMEEIVERYAQTFHTFSLSTDTAEGEFYVVFDATTSIDETMFTWVNSSFLFDGGKCNTQFFNAFFDSVAAHLERDAKRLKSAVTRNDIRENLIVFANIRLKNPEYDSQAKTRLTGPDLRKEMTAMVQEQWKAFVRKHDKWLQTVLERATVRHHSTANKKAIDEHQKGLKRRVPGLLDATSKVRSNCQLLITEGDSAKSQISEARNPQDTAAFALRGKVNNVYGMSPAQVLKMDKITDLLSAIGLTPGKRAVRSDLRYGKIVIATDADYDGDDIFTLLINMLYRFWPELFDPNYEPYVHRLVAPNVVASKNGKRIHFTTRTQYENDKDKYVGWTIEYMKGLGSMNKIDWQMILSGKTDTQIPITDDGEMPSTLKLLFGDDADRRKQWLQTT